MSINIVPEGRFFSAADCDSGALAGLVVAVLGYGNLGRSMALNLRDSGCQVIIGNIDDEYRLTAEADGFEVHDLAAADLVFALLPDEIAPRAFAEEVGVNLRNGAAVVFASGYTLAFDLIKPPAGVDVLLLAPRMPGPQVREAYIAGSGFIAYINVEQDATGRGWQRLLGLVAASGALRRGAIRLSAVKEAALDLFVEQTVGAYLGLAIQFAVEISVEAGIPAEAMVMELYMSGEMAATFQGFAEDGFYASVAKHGLVATFGGYQGTLAIDAEAMRRRLEEGMATIRSGDFARKLQDEEAAGYPTTEAIRTITQGDNPITNAERSVRAALDSP